MLSLHLPVLCVSLSLSSSAEKEAKVVPQGVLIGFIEIIYIHTYLRIVGFFFLRRCVDGWAFDLAIKPLPEITASYTGVLEFESWLHSNASCLRMGTLGRSRA